MKKLLLALAFVLGVVGPVVAQPARVTARIVGYELRGSGATLLIAAGADQGVTKDWRVYLVDDKGRRVEGGELTMIRVDKRITFVRTERKADEIRGLRAALEP